MSKTKLLLLVIDLIFIHTVDSSNVHYITPTQCPVEESCLTLSTLAANISNYLNSNTTIVFLEGNHILDSGLVVSNIDGSLTLSTNGSGTAAIVCSENVSLEFSNITKLQISGLEFIGCSSKVERVDQFTLEDSRFHGGSDNSALYLTHTNTNIVCSSFVSNTAGTYQSHVKVLEYLRDNRYDFYYSYRPTIQSTSARVGGALTVTSSTVNISSSRFESNTATVGGAIFSQLGSDMTISNSTFINNSATGGSDDRCHGGALFIESGCTVTAHNSTFIDNTAGYGGGAISLFQGTFIDSTHNVYSSNRADGFGGAISAYYRSRITIDNSYYSNNSGRYGGVVYTQSYGSITVGNSSFDNNVAGSGGVMCAYSSSNITVGNSSFDNNVAGRDGGVMFADYSSSITVGNSSFDNNVAGSGGVMCAYSSSNITVGNSSFDNNVAGRDGGVMFADYSSSITVGNSSFDNNVAGSGGVMCAYSSSNITVGNSSFDNNVAGPGGVMSAYYSSSITVGNSSFDNNEAGDDGGVMSAYYSCSITVGNSSFDNNVAGSGGVMCAYSSSNITVGNSSFDNNVAGSGGVMSAYYSSSITVGNSSFDNNEAGDDGGVMSAYYSCSITVGNSSFDNNEAGDDGGVMSAYYSSSITVGNSSFDNNVAGRDGGVMFADYSSSITVGNSSFDNNEAGDDGGVMSAYYSSSITVGNSSFDNNVAGRDGGVMFADYSSNITVGNSSFDNNEAGDDGGVMSAVYRSSITVGNSSFDNNEAGRDGGVMSAQDSSSITVGNSSFDNNEAGRDGGVMSARDRSSITVGNSSFDNNEAGCDGGVMSARDSSSITLGNSSFDNNEADNDGGVVYVYSSTTGIIFENNCTFFNNSALEGGVIYVHGGSFKDVGNTYYGNTASNGGAILLDEGDVNITTSSFVNNTAGNIGGVLYVPSYAYKDHIALAGSTFHSNRATSGGVIALLSNDNLIVTESTFSYNNAIRGGAIHLLIGNKLTVKYSNFSHNSANSDGGVIYSADQNKLTVSNSTLNFNTAGNNGGVLCSLFQTKLTITGETCTFIGNQGHRGGVVYASESKIIVYSQILLMANNTAIDDGGAVYLSSTNVTFFNGHNTIARNVAKSGGAISVIESQLIFSYGSCKLVGNQADYGGAIHASESQLIFSYGNCNLVGNQADYGGAIYAIESKLVIEVNSWTEIIVSTNFAMHHGGGLYMTTSELNIKGHNLYITKNRATSKGGGIHAANSSIITKGAIHLISNEAENGGAISLEKNAKLKGISAKKINTVNLTSNRANRRGGALYVDDETNPEMCAVVSAQNDSEVVSSRTGCFSKSVFINFSDNSAGVSGSNLFGGLLDRCTVHTELYQKSETNELGLASFQNSSNIDESQLDTVSSSPVRLCFCRDGRPDCDYQPEPIQVNRGKAFSLQLIAHDHISKPVRAAVDIGSSASGIIAGQYIDKACTEVELQFNLFTLVDSETLTLSVVGPCNVNGVSTKSIMIQFICTCPIGFQAISNDNETSCDCVCVQVLQSYEKTECNPTTESITRRENFWISYVNHTWSNSSGYVIYPHCPFDYCYTPDKQVSINLNHPNGSDAQCDLNRMGTLCGTCKPGLSVSLGSSKCVHCPTYWPALLVTITIVFIVSGIGLVAFLLALNLTVAIGTLNAIIFYANIVAANKSALFPSGVSFASVFISWLNFDLGFDVCFFNGMGTYIKMWLQLAFPAYIIILVVVIIQLSYYFDAFGRLVGKKYPVATLATLILLSYAKLLQTIITAFSSATLVYPDGSKKTLWLPDATIEYFTSKHAGLFFTAVLILLVGLLYTLLLFSWQWFLCCPRKRVKWIRNPKLSAFMEIYHVPYTPNHRYWTGLLLLVRVSVYLVSAFNPSGDPRVTLSSTVFILTSLVIYIATFGVRMYKNCFINAMETLTYFNIIALSIFTWYTIDADTNHQTAVTNISIGITFIQLTAVILYHVYKHTNQKLSAMIQGSIIFVKVKGKFSKKKQKKVNHEPVPADEDIHQFYELLDMIDRPVNTNDYNIPQVKPKPAEPTQSVVEPPKPLLVPANPPPLEAIKEEPDLESGEEESEQDGIDVIQVENISQEINKNKKSINNHSGVEIVDSECNNTSTNPECEMEHVIILKENSIPKPHSNPQFNNGSDLDKEAAMEIPRSDNMNQSSEEAAPLPAASGEQEGVGSHCVIVEAEIHDY